MKFVENEDLKDEDYDNVIQKISMITGNGINYLMNHLKILEPMFGQRTRDKERKIFQIVSDIWHVLHQNIDFYNDDNLKRILSLIKELLALLPIYSSEGTYVRFFFSFFQFTVSNSNFIICKYQKFQKI